MMVADETLYDDMPTNELFVVMLAQHIVLKAMARRRGVETVSSFPARFMKDVQKQDFDALTEEIQTLRLLHQQ